MRHPTKVLIGVVVPACLVGFLIGGEALASTRAQAPRGASVAASPARSAIAGPVCTTEPSSDANVNTDCENHYDLDFGHADLPVEETTIAVNPTDPLNMIGAAKTSK